MRAYDFTITVPNKTGTLAKLSEMLHKDGVNVEGLAIFEQGTDAYFHLLTKSEAKSKTVHAITECGYTVKAEREVIVEQVEDRPGVLAEITRRIADEGINLTIAYLATGTRLVLGCSDVMALEKVWKSVPAAVR